VFRGAQAPGAVRRPLTAEPRFQSKASPCGICGGQSGTETDFIPSISVFSCHNLFHRSKVNYLAPTQCPQQLTEPLNNVLKKLIGNESSLYVFKS
jgi:hypothetical protein